MNKIAPDVTIEQLASFSSNDAKTIRQLATKLGPSFQPLSDQDLKDMLKSKTTHLFVARESKKQRIVGMGTLAIYRIPYLKKAYFDDFVVDEEYRGHGIGSKLIEKILVFAKELGATYIELTANSKRLVANKLYKKIGFVKQDTNVFRLTFSYPKSE